MTATAHSRRRFFDRALRLPKPLRFYIFPPRAALAQLGEHLICNQAVSGSSPLGGSNLALTRVSKNNGLRQSVVARFV